MAQSDQLAPATDQAPAGPVRPAERIAVLDIVRGFALFGILAVNMAWFYQPLYGNFGATRPALGPLDEGVAWLIRFLFESKFYSLFAFLFGIGVGIQAARAQARGERFRARALRRFGVLLVIGLIHAYLIWIGDILVSYALVGVVLLLFLRRSPRALLIWAALLLAVVPLLSAVGVVLLELARLTPAAPEIAQAMAESQRDLDRRNALAQQVYASGDYLAITAQRARDLAFLYPMLLFIAPNVLAMFLIGLATVKAGIVQNLAAQGPLLRRVMVWGLAIGLPANAVYATAGGQASAAEPSWTMLAGLLAGAVGAPALSLGYAATLAMLARQSPWSGWLARLAPAGRMALTNYLLQSIVCTLIFYGYGLGLAGRIGPAVGFALTIAIYLLQLPLSAWWLSRFQYGPVEWVWRRLTYGGWRRADGQRLASAEPRQPV